MSNADLIKRLMSITASIDALYRSERQLFKVHDLDVDAIREAADALEQCERAKVELALETSKLRARLNRWERKK